MKVVLFIIGQIAAISMAAFPLTAQGPIAMLFLCF
jgi:hypothetical protein